MYVKNKETRCSFVSETSVFFVLKCYHVLNKSEKVCVRTQNVDINQKQTKFFRKLSKRFAGMKKTHYLCNRNQEQEVRGYETRKVS